jgi:hypothetical protein
MDLRAQYMPRRPAHFIITSSGVRMEYLGFPHPEDSLIEASPENPLTNFLNVLSPDESAEAELLHLFVSRSGFHPCSAEGSNALKKVGEASRSGRDLSGLSLLEREIAITNKFAVSVALAARVCWPGMESTVRALADAVHPALYDELSGDVYRVALSFIMPYGVVIDGINARESDLLETDGLAASTSSVEFIFEPRNMMGWRRPGRFERIRKSSAKIAANRLKELSDLENIFRNKHAKEWLLLWLNGKDSAVIEFRKDAASGQTNWQNLGSMPPSRSGDN